MEWVRSYVLTVAAAGILCAMVKALTDSTGSKRILQLICGVFLTLAALSPLHSVDFSGWDGNLEGFQAEAASVQASAEAAAQEQMEGIIQERLEAYVVEAGKYLGVELEVRITLGEEKTPEAVCISGAVSPYIKARLETILSGELGIPKERQEWK